MRSEPLGEMLGNAVIEIDAAKRADPSDGVQDVSLVLIHHHRFSKAVKRNPLVAHALAQRDPDACIKP
jgi:hypothetical protein